MDLKIRKETPSDEPKVDELIREAFGRSGEADLVERLRTGAAFIPNLSLVAEADGQVIGYILFSPVQIRDDRGAQSESLLLAPLSVRPAWQRRGIGSHLVNMGLAVARELGYRTVLVRGSDGYCLRFGFVAAENFTSSEFMALELVPDSLRLLSGSVIFPPGFQADA